MAAEAAAEAALVEFGIIKDMDFLLELFSGRMFLATIQSRGYNYV